MSKDQPAREQFETALAALVDRFTKHHDEYLRADYSEAEVRAEFIDPLFEALGWDVQNRAGRSPKEREVIREKGETTGRPDYAFQLEGRARFYVEAKAPHVPLERVDVVLQAKSYAWHSRDVFVAAVTDFEEFRLYDATAKPDRKHPNTGLIFAYRFDEYLQPQALDNLWLLSRDAVAAGSIDQLLKKSSVQARQRVPVDQAFLEDLTAWRAQLAKAMFKVHPDLSPADLNSVVQVFLDRLIFIRICEDRKIMAPRQLAEIAENWEFSGKRVSLTNDLNALFHEVNARLNGEIFKPHLCEKMDWDINAALVADIIRNLYFPVSPYQFDKIPVELLGSIYERYLGKTIRVTATRAVVEDKPEVRKAGGVYYTPKYIVDYIGEQTVGKLIEGRSPTQIAKLRILDPACGSGSFLLGAYQKLLDYHTQYYAGRARQRDGAASEQARLLRDASADYGEFKLSLEQKAQILRNNIYGVDIDPQAVEITMMSLYIKMLECERGAIYGNGLLPRLGGNIKCGNSLIGYDIGELSDEDKTRINPFDWNSKSEGFGKILEAGGFDAVIGNPPWGAEIGDLERRYLAARHPDVADFESSQYFLMKGISLLNPKGLLGMIIPNTFALNVFARKCRERILDAAEVALLADLSEVDVFVGASVRSIIMVLSRDSVDKCRVFAFGASPSNIEQIGGASQRKLRELETWKELFVGKTPLSRLVARLLKPGLMLADYCDVRQGYIPYRTTTLTRRFGRAKAEEIVKQRLWHSTKRESAQYQRELQGGDVGRYSLTWSGVWVRYGEWVSTHLPLSVFSGPRVLIREITGQPPHVLLTTYTEDVFVHNPSVLAVLPRPDSVSPKFILGVLNSALMSAIFTHIAPKAKKGLFPKIIITDARRLPFPRLSLFDPADQARHDKMVTLVERMLDLHAQHQATTSETTQQRIQREIHVTDEQIDALVYELYGLTPEEIGVVEASSK
jgi:type I restriction-modification system DNA methylase subunit